MSEKGLKPHNDSRLKQNKKINVNTNSIKNFNGKIFPEH